MFPFLSVLCTVIGVLVLFIVLILSTRVIEQEELVRKTEAHQRRPTPGDPSAVEQGIDPATFDQLAAELERLKGVLAQRQDERLRLSRKLAGLEDLLEYKKTQQLKVDVTRGREFVKPEPVVVVEESAAEGPADAFKVTLKPQLVEVSAQGYTLHPSRQAFPAIAAPAGAETDPLKLQVAPELKALLAGIDRNKSKEYLVFLIHPNGVQAFDNMRLYLIQHHPEIRLGWEPFSREWIVVNDALNAEAPRTRR
jgi:hypothetical protein